MQLITYRIIYRELAGIPSYVPEEMLKKCLLCACANSLSCLHCKVKLYIQHKAQYSTLSLARFSVIPTYYYVVKAVLLVCNEKELWCRTMHRVHAHRAAFRSTTF